MSCNKRLPLFDALKGFAILMVVYTHVLQYVGVGYYLDNPMFEFTYAFHMPLFMTISGYFSRSAPQIRLPDLLKKKAVALLLPCLTAGIIIVLLNQAFHCAPKYARFTYLYFNLWYLKSLFGCYLVAWVSLRLLRGRLLAAIILSLLASLFLPGLFHWPFMMPFFWAGYVWRKQPDWFLRHGRWAGPLAVVLFGALWPWWDGKMTVYCTPLCLVDYKHLAWSGANLWPHILRLLIGAAGTVASLSLFTWLYHDRQKTFPPLERMGRRTLEIYVLHFFLIHLALFRYVAIPYVPWLYEFAYCPLITLVVFAGCYVSVRLISKNRVLSLLFFGKSGG